MTEAADKWIRAFKENTAGVKLATGVIKAILIKVEGQQTATEILVNGKVRRAIGNNNSDDGTFLPHRNEICRYAAYMKKKTPNPDKILTKGFSAVFVVLGVLNNVLKVYQSLTNRKV